MVVLTTQMFETLLTHFWVEIKDSFEIAIVALICYGCPCAKEAYEEEIYYEEIIDEEVGH